MPGISTPSPPPTVGVAAAPQHKGGGLVELLEGCAGGPAFLSCRIPAIVLAIVLFWLGEHLTSSLRSLPATSEG